MQRVIWTYKCSGHDSLLGVVKAYSHLRLEAVEGAQTRTQVLYTLMCEKILIRNARYLHRCNATQTLDRERSGIYRTTADYNGPTDSIKD